MGWGGSKHNDKRGNTSGGSSSGRSGQKRGGTSYTADQNSNQDRGPLTCTQCNGAGKIDRPVEERDEDGQFAGADRMDCPTCDGTGKINQK